MNQSQPHFQEIVAKRFSRRAILAAGAGLPLASLVGCVTPDAADPAAPAANGLTFSRVPATNADTVTLPPGYRAQVLIAWGDALYEGAAAFDPDALTRAEQEQRFGQNNDMLALFATPYAFPPPADSDTFLLCANHEYADPALMFPGRASLRDYSAADWQALFASIGVSVVRVARSGRDWRVVRDAAPGAGHNRRITPFTPVMFEGPAAAHRWIAAAAPVVNAAEANALEGSVACGTLANCAGGLTPWGTYLSAEENFDGYYVINGASPELTAARGDAAYVRACASTGVGLMENFPNPLGPAQFDLAANPYGPALYGWIVEIDPYDPSWAPRKRTALGRKKAECANTALTQDARVAVYSGDDQVNEFVYKFVSTRRFNASDRLANRELLNDGSLYAARFEADGRGVWLALTLEAANAAAAAAGIELFSDKGDVAMRAREAARLLGATPMDRPEDVEPVIDGEWVGNGVVLIACTNNRTNAGERPANPRRPSVRAPETQPNFPGHIVQIREDGGDCGATAFAWDIFALAGDPGASETTTPFGAPADVGVAMNGQATFSGDRFACPDNLCIDASRNVWVATDGSDAVFGDCNDQVIAIANEPGAKPAMRFLVGPMGAEICGPLMSPDQRAFLCALQHPGEGRPGEASFTTRRWQDAGVRPVSDYPDGNGAWPRSAVVVVTKDDGGIIGT